MEADWSVALAADDPVITVPWQASGEDPGKCRFVDLRLHSHLIDEIEEAKERPPLRTALLLLNGGLSPFWTAKCDAWAHGADAGDALYDRYEMDAEPGETAFGAGSYIDLLARDSALFSCFERQERWLRVVTERLRVTPARAVRVELVLRPAEVEAVPGFAVTWFVEGCDATAHRAGQRWGKALDLALAVLMEIGFDTKPAGDTMVETGE
jgi:hypothetical protein